jgi:hypothetical protein
MSSILALPVGHGMMNEDRSDRTVNIVYVTMGSMAALLDQETRDTLRNTVEELCMDTQGDSLLESDEAAGIIRAKQGERGGRGEGGGGGGGGGGGAGGAHRLRRRSQTARGTIKIIVHDQLGLDHDRIVRTCMQLDQLGQAPPVDAVVPDVYLHENGHILYLRGYVTSIYIIFSVAKYVH